MVQINWFWRWFSTLSLVAGGRFAACGPSASAGAASEAQANHNLCFGCCSCGRSRTTNSEMSSVFSCSNVENVCRTPSSLSGSRHWTYFILRTVVTRVVHKLRSGFVYKIFLNSFLCTKVLKSLAICHYLFQADLYNYLSNLIEFNHHAFYSSKNFCLEIVVPLQLTEYRPKNPINLEEMSLGSTLLVLCGRGLEYSLRTNAFLLIISYNSVTVVCWSMYKIH